METFSVLLAICEGNPTITGGFPTQKLVTRNFDVSFICTWTNSWANNRGAGYLGRHRVHYDITLMVCHLFLLQPAYLIWFQRVVYERQSSLHQKVPFSLIHGGWYRVFFFFARSIWLTYVSWSLTHRGRDKTAPIFQTTFWNGFSWMKMCEIWSRFHWSLSLGVQLTMFQHWFRYLLGADQATSHHLNQWRLGYWHIYASLGLIESIKTTSIGKC